MAEMNAPKPVVDEAAAKAAADKAAAEKAKAEKAAADKAAAEKAKAEKAAADKAAAEKAAKPAAKAKTWKIKTPVEGYTGRSRGVAFVDGEGTTDNEWFAQRCKDAGYKVTEV